MGVDTAIKKGSNIVTTCGILLLNSANTSMVNVLVSLSQLLSSNTVNENV